MSMKKCFTKEIFNADFKSYKSIGIFLVSWPEQPAEISEIVKLKKNKKSQNGRLSMKKCFTRLIFTADYKFYK